MNWRHKVAALVALPVVAASLALVGGATLDAASAHTGDLSASAVCQDNGTYLVTYKLAVSQTNETGSTKWSIGGQTFAHTPTSNADLPGTVQSNTVASTGTQTITLGTQVVPGSSTQANWAYAFTTWSPDNFKKGSDGGDITLAGTCKPKIVNDSAFTKSVSNPTCSTGAILTYSGTNVTFSGPASGTVGTGANVHVSATPNSGHAYSDGTTGAKDVFNGALAGPLGVDTDSCAAKDAAANVTVTTPSCTTAGLASVTGLVNATEVGTLDETPGTHTANFQATSGHRFSDGSKTKAINYTIAGKDHSLCASVNPAQPTVTESVCKPNFGGPTQPVLNLPADDSNFTYTVVYTDGGRTGTVTATLINPDANLGVPSGWTQTSDTTETQAFDLEVKRCAAPPPCTACNLPKIPDTSGTLDCKGTYVGGVYDAVTVMPGRDCTLVNVYVNGGIHANGAHSLHLAGSDIRGSVHARRVFDFSAGSINAACSADPMVGGNVDLRGVHNAVLCNMQVCGWVKIQNSDGRIMVKHSRMDELVVTHNDRFVKDGSPNHKAPGTIRLYNDQSHRFVINHNQRPVQKRHLQHVGRIKGGKICTIDGVPVTS